MSPNPHLTQAPDQQTELSASGAAAAAQPRLPDPREVLSRFFDAINNEDYSALETVLAPETVDHDPAAGQRQGVAGYQTIFGDLRRALPDLRLAVDHVMATGDEVAVAYSMTGTHTGREYQGKTADGAGIDIRGVLIAVVRDGRIVERWGASDQLTLRTQLGVPVQ